MIKKIRISILIPCFNSATFLPKLFNCIRAQTIPFDEIICYDDCSTDNTIEVAKKLGAIVIKGDKNRGAAYGRNRMIDATSCEWIHFHDSDDLIANNFVEMVKNIIFINDFSEDSLTCILSDMLVRDIDTNIKIGETIYIESEINSDPIKYFLNQNGYAIIGCYPKQLLKKINGFSESLLGNEDPDLHVRLALSGAKFKCIGHPLAINLIRKTSFSASNWFQCLSDKLKCITLYSQDIDSKYFDILAQQTAILSNYFYREGDKKLSKSARTLAFKLGLRKVSNSTFSILISNTLGPKFYLWLYRRRVDLNLI